MRNIVVYGSRYGTTKSYAEEFASRHAIEAISFSSLDELSEYYTVIHFGALLAGGVYGLKKTLSLLDQNGSQNLVVVTVGLSDPANTKNTDSLKNAIKEQVPENIFKHTKIYHLRGGIDYKKLSLMHRLMMYMVYRQAKRKADAESNEMVTTYNKKVSFVDFDTLNQIIL